MSVQASREVFGLLESNWRDNAGLNSNGPYFNLCRDAPPANVTHEGDVAITISNPTPPNPSLPAQKRQKVTLFLYKADGTATSPVAFLPKTATPTPLCTVPATPSLANLPFCFLDPGQSAMFLFGSMPNSANQPRTIRILAQTVDASGNNVADEGVLLASGIWWLGVNNQCKGDFSVSPILFAGGKPF